MAVFVTIDGVDKIAKWHVGEEFPKMVGLIHSVVEVQADGDELMFIHDMTYPTIPFTANSVVQRWFGDHAKFIVANVLQ